MSELIPCPYCDQAPEIRPYGDHFLVGCPIAYSGEADEFHRGHPLFGMLRSQSDAEARWQEHVAHTQRLLAMTPEIEAAIRSFEENSQ